jgi:AcrR family transcriptional regulator
LTKREEQRQERRQQILECSLDLIITRGYDAMKIRDIADRLGISIGLFFNYFESKENVYEELIKIGLSGPQGVLQFDANNSRPIEIFQQITQTIFSNVQSNSFVAKMFILMAQSCKSETAPASVKAMLADFDVYTPIIPLIELGQQMGEIKPGNPIALAVTYWGAIQGVAENMAMQPDLPMPESDWVVDILRA